MSSPETPATPALRVVRGDPTPEELAALVAVVAARSAAGGAAVEPPAPRSAWSRGAGIRRPLPPPERGAWRASGRPG